MIDHAECTFQPNSTIKNSIKKFEYEFSLIIGEQMKKIRSKAKQLLSPKADNSSPTDFHKKSNSIERDDDLPPGCAEILDNDYYKDLGIKI